MDNGVIKEIIECAKMNRKKLFLAGTIYYSTKTTSRYCKKYFNRNYVELRNFMVEASIYELLLLGYNTKQIADELFEGDSSNLCKYVKTFSDVPLKQIIIEGGHKMTNAQKQVLEAQVLMVLTHSTKNVTRKQLNVPYSVIKSLRDKNFDIISVPGRYNGGYNLNASSKQNCLDWINKIRVNRFGISGNYTF